MTLKSVWPPFRYQWRSKPTPMLRTVLYLERNIDGTIGGSYRSLLYLVQLLDKRRYRPIVVFYREHHLVEEFRKTGCKVLLLEYPSAIRLLHEKTAETQAIWSPLRLVVRLLQKGLNFFSGSVRMFFRNLVLLAKEHVDLIHLNNGMFTAPELLLASKMLAVRTVVHQRGIGKLPKAVSWLATVVDHVICVSDAARTNLEEQGVPPAKCTTIHNGIDPDGLIRSINRTPEMVRQSLGIPFDCPVIGNAGMIRPWKGQFVLVRAMGELRDQHPTARCLIVGGISDVQEGDRVYRDEILEFVRAHKLEDQVCFLDYQPRIGEFMQIFDIMVHTAVDPEPFSRSVLEGMTLGRAMIATRTGGTPEAIEDGVSGILVPPNDPKVLADRIDMLLRDPNYRMRLGGCAQERIRQHFMIQANVRATERVYQSVLKEAGNDKEHNPGRPAAI